MFNENQIYDNYISGITKIGRTTMLLGMVATLAPALLMTFYFGYNPGISAIIAGAICQISVSGAFWFSEPISYYPIVGRAGLYMTFLSGNTVNVRIPAAISAQQASGHLPGTNKGSIMGTVGMGVSVWVCAILLTISIIAGETLLAKVPASFMTVLSLIIPALFGGIFTQFAIKSPKTGAFALIVCYIMMQVVKILPGNLSFLITVVAVFSSIYVAKKLMDKELKKKGITE
ncbi:MAG: hypothetical protein ACLVH8_01440 [Fusobacterium sp.]|nr:hypothetical protein [Fusobacterium sp.]